MFVVQAVVQFTHNVTYSCQEGQRIVGDATPNCTADGNLTSVPYCHALYCNVPLIDNGTADRAVVQFTHNVTYSCQEGQRIVGDATPNCTADGNLTSVPYCHALYCNVPLIDNGTADRAVVQFTHNVTYSCQEGQRIVGDATPNCTADGNLTSVPYCHALYCNVPLIDNGTADRAVVQFTHNVTYSCQEGQRIVGDATPNCTADGNLTSVPYCHALYCNVPLIDNGTADRAVVQFTHNVTYSCQEGQRIVGDATPNCTADGNLTSVPYCHALYCNVPLIDNGTADRAVVQFTHNVTYSCQEGQRIVGDATPNCTADGNLTSVPYCHALYCNVPLIDNGTADRAVVQFTHNVTYSCQEGQRIVGDATPNCTADGNLTSVPYCHALYCNVPLIDNGTADRAVVQFTHNVTYSCQEGQRIVGDATPNCTADGNLTSVPYCHALYCNVPLIDNGTADRAVVQFTHNVTYSCQEGQRIVGDATPNCTADGNLTSVPYCHALYCNVPLIDNGTADRAVVQFTHNVTYSCQEGQRIVGDATPNCTADGNLTSVPYCHALYCNVPLIDNGTADRAVVQFTHNVTYSCQEGQRIVGDATPNCTADGNLTSVPYCHALYCNVPVIANGTADRTVVQFTHSVTYSCQEGQGIVGDATPNCTADGNLTSVPYCDGKGSD
ncbi:sushi, von Willebrand factor type A, EGF and pentraxin domain-containing protein 1-like [Sycon ciliatum]|uniref:sushi, von Willebrand factor type A, EGF and pentraxin domain-containing protein 1-like n=1 Tax=Sycon ciliatum TaxID=27933 RepID=UPI0031F614C3